MKHPIVLFAILLAAIIVRWAVLMFSPYLIPLPYQLSGYYISCVFKFVMWFVFASWAIGLIILLTKPSDFLVRLILLAGLFLCYSFISLVILFFTLTPVTSHPYDSVYSNSKNT